MLCTPIGERRCDHRRRIGFDPTTGLLGAGSLGRLTVEAHPGGRGPAHSGYFEGMDHVRLGTTGLLVSKLCLGTMTMGLQSDGATSASVLDRAAEGGITFIDTADVYPLGGGLPTVGRTEEIVGGWLQDKRDRFVVATK